jgi:hypothetical protein
MAIAGALITKSGLIRPNGEVSEVLPQIEHFTS